MNHAILAVLLIVGQALSSVPRKASNPTTSSGEGVKKKASDKQAALPRSNFVHTEVKQNPRNSPSSDNAPKTVLVRELPAVSVRTDWWQRAYVMSTALLVLIGGFGVFFASRTLKAVERQAVSMRRQTTHLRMSVIMARRSARAAQKQAATSELAATAARNNAAAAKANTDALMSIERAWLVVEFPTPFPSIRIVGDQAELTVTAKNCGRTPAWLVEYVSRVLVSPNPPQQVVSLLDYGSPYEVGGQPIIPNDAENFFTLWRVEGQPSQTRSQIRNGTLHFYVYGVFRYNDIFSRLPHQEVRQTYFCFHNVHRTDYAGVPQEGWETEPPEANRQT